MASATLRKRLAALEGRKPRILAGVVLCPSSLSDAELDVWISDKIAEMEAQGYRHDDRYGLAILPETATDETWDVLVEQATHHMRRIEMWSEAIVEGRASRFSPGLS